MDENKKNVQEMRKKLEGMFADAQDRVIETAIKGFCGPVCISAGYTPAERNRPLESSYFMVTGENMFPEYVHGMDSLAELICRYGSVIREQEEHIVNGFYNEPIKEGHPSALSPQEWECYVYNEQIPDVYAGF